MFVIILSPTSVVSVVPVTGPFVVCLSDVAMLGLVSLDSSLSRETASIVALSIHLLIQCVLLVCCVDQLQRRV